MPVKGPEGTKNEDKERRLVKVLSNITGSAIVYARTRKSTNRLAKELASHGITSGIYHGGLSTVDRSRVQDQWLENKFRVMVATNAFGMGIDKPDVRLVIHWDLPENLESYYQEAGRAGRDQQKSFAVTLYHDNDISSLEKWVFQSYPGPEFIRKVYQGVANYFKLAIGSGKLASFDFDLDSFCTQHKLKRVETYNALKKLEENDLILLSQAFHHPSKVLFETNSHELYKFQVSNPGLDPLIKTLLRMHGGELFAGFTRISETKISNYGEMDIKTVEDGLNKLHQRKIIHYIRQSSKPQITFLSPRLSSSNLPISSKQLLKRKENDLKKMKAMIRFLGDSVRCRSLQIQEYFGEISYDRCGICDNCLSRKGNEKQKSVKEEILKILDHSETSPARILDQFGLDDEQLLLDTIREMLENQEIAYDKFGQLKLAKTPG